MKLYNHQEVLTLKYFDILDESVINGTTLLRKINETIQSIPSDIKIVCIFGFDLLVSATSSYNFKMGTISSKIWYDFFKNLKTKFILSCSKNTALDLINENIWSVHIETTNNDRLFVLNSIFSEVFLDVNKLLIYVRNTSLKTIQITAVQTRNRILSNSGVDVEEEFKKILYTLDSRALDVRTSVVQPSFEVDMVGLEGIVEELRREIINPIKLGCKEIPICKGMLLYGPSGTGKSTVGRWLSHELQGRVYLAETSSSDSLISSFTRLLKVACHNSPSVVFLDDFESILESSGCVRELLVLLDGINIKGRENVCIVATCMNIGNVPEALIRGNRLEKCIEFSCPELKVIVEILKNRFNKIIENTNNIILKNLLSNLIKLSNITEIARFLIGWTPSNIQLLIDSVVRKIAYSNNLALEEIKSIFKDESYRIEENIKRSLRGINNTKTTDNRIYN